MKQRCEGRPAVHGRRLPRSFYSRPVLQVARDSVGKVLVHQTRGVKLTGRIVETEAYRGPGDRAAHSWAGRRTRRTEVMFGRAGHIYVFLIYGMHWNFNLVTGGVDEPEAVLIRAVEPLSGVHSMARRRRVEPESVALTNGPGKLCGAFGFDGRHYGLDLCAGPVWLMDAPRPKIARSSRVGVDYAGAWALKPWRFYDPASPYVSRGARLRA